MSFCDARDRSHANHTLGYASAVLYSAQKLENLKKKKKNQAQAHRPLHASFVTPRTSQVYTYIYPGIGLEGKKTKLGYFGKNSMVKEHRGRKMWNTLFSYFSW